MKFSRRMKIGLLGVVIAAVIIVPVYAYLASGTLHFDTTLSVPFQLTSDPIPSTMHYESAIVLHTETKDLDNSAYANVRTNYKIWRDGGGMDPSYLTVHVKDVVNDFDLTFTVSGSTIVATIGPYSTPAGFDVFTDVTVTFHNAAPLDGYHADVWVTVG
jgi:hypothetical protein